MQKNLLVPCNESTGEAPPQKDMSLDRLQALRSLLSLSDNKLIGEEILKICESTEDKGTWIAGASLIQHLFLAGFLVPLVTSGLLELLPYEDPSRGFMANFSEWGIRSFVTTIFLNFGCPLGYVQLMKPGAISWKKQFVAGFLSAMVSLATQLCLGFLGIYPIPWRSILLGVGSLFNSLALMKHFSWSVMTPVELRDCFLLCLTMVSICLIYVLFQSAVGRFPEAAPYLAAVLPGLKILKRIVGEQLIIQHSPEAGPLVYVGANAFHLIMMLMSLKSVSTFSAVCAISVDGFYEFISLLLLKGELNAHQQDGGSKYSIERGKRFYYIETELIRNILGICAMPLALLFTQWATLGWNSRFYIGYGGAGYGMQALHPEFVGFFFAWTGALLLIHLTASVLRAYMTIRACGSQVLVLANHTIEKSALYIFPITSSFYIFSIGTMWKHSGNDFTMKFDWIPSNQQSEALCTSLAISLATALLGPLSVLLRMCLSSQKVSQVAVEDASPSPVVPAPDLSRQE